MALNTSTDVLKRSPAWERRTASEAETLEVARALGAQLHGGDWLMLVGELGAGKTVFARGVGEALRCREPARSPTYVLVQTYKAGAGAGHLALRHVDLHRLTPPEVVALEWEDLYSLDGVTLVEWAEKAQALWPENALALRIEHDGNDGRKIKFFGAGARAGELVERLKQTMSRKGKTA